MLRDSLRFISFTWPSSLSQRCYLASSRGSTLHSIQPLHASLSSSSLLSPLFFPFFFLFPPLHLRIWEHPSFFLHQLLSCLLFIIFMAFMDTNITRATSLSVFHLFLLFFLLSFSSHLFSTLRLGSPLYRCHYLLSSCYSFVSSFSIFPSFFSLASYHLLLLPSFNSSRTIRLFCHSILLPLSPFSPVFTLVLVVLSIYSLRSCSKLFSALPLPAHHLPAPTLPRLLGPKQ